MTNTRYFSSFTITTLLYTAGALGVMWLWSATPPSPKIKEEVIKIAVIVPPKPVVKPQPTLPPTPPQPQKPEPPKIDPKPLPKPKPKPKKVIEKPKPKKVVKKVIPKPKPKPKPQPVVEQIVSEPIVRTEAKVVEVAPPPPPPQPKIDLSAKKRMFLKNVRSSIYAHKKYPPIAKRRNIQGRVKVTFDISQGGQISNIQTSGGSKILQKAARKSVLESAPFTIPSVLSGQFPMQNVSINIDFKLQ